MKLRIQLFALLGVVLAVTATCSNSDKPTKVNLEPAKPDDTSVSAEAPAFGPIVVTGEPLPTRSDEGTDKAIGRAAPVVEGRAPDNATPAHRWRGQTDRRRVRRALVSPLPERGPRHRVGGEGRRVR